MTFIMRWHTCISDQGRIRQRTKNHGPMVESGFILDNVA